MRFFLGGYSPDLHVAWLNTDDGSLEIIAKVTTPANASYLRYVPEYSVVYATVESGYHTGESGKIAAYRVDESGELTAIGSIESCGSSPCHLDVDPDRCLLAAANYGGANFMVARLTESGGFAEPAACVKHRGHSVNASRQAEPHPHGVYFSPDGKHLSVCDLGTDKIMRYQIDALLAGVGSEAGEPAASVTPGSGPRHLSYSADGGFAYLVTELANTMVVYRVHPGTGDFEQLQELSTLPELFDGENTAGEVQIHPNGRFVYASNRGHDTIAVFARDEQSGLLEPAGHFDTTGNGPRHFQIDPSGAWCLVSNQFSDHVVSFRIDPKTGMGRWSGKSVHVVEPSCTEFRR
ncbi:MAG: lactonase family protein [Spirochaetota bacterium]